MDKDTIAAPATGAEEAGVAIVRVSGSESAGIAERVFRAKTNISPENWPDRLLVFGNVVDDKLEVVDECLAVLMRSPHSFTGEDVLEIHCHGGPAVVRGVLDVCLAAGARMAQPGEFSRRAFMNGRMDVAQAEGLADLVYARTAAARKIALQQLRGGISGRIAGIRARLVDAAAEIEAHLDFPDEDIPALVHERVLLGMRESVADVLQILSTFERGRIMREGARVVIAGKPNAGKSSLFNALVGRERAIVSPHPGTTRDTVESTIEMRGIEVTLIDTAGLRSGGDVLEQMGIERTTAEIERADLIIHVVDGTDASASPLPHLETPVITVANKCDLADENQVDARAVRISAKTRSGLDALEDAIAKELVGDSRPDEIDLVRARHAECLRSCLDSLEKAESSYVNEFSGEFLMVDLRAALIHLGEITGEQLDEEILDRIFTTFCLGK